jgi:hypothetical protein
MATKKITLNELRSIVKQIIKESEQKFPEQIWKELPPVPNQQTWDKILAHMASQFDGGYEKKEDLILTIGGIAKGTTSSGAYSGWVNSKKQKQQQPAQQQQQQQQPAQQQPVSENLRLRNYFK